jgi:hypothetical protein
MDICLNPQYEIGQKLNKELFIEGMFIDSKPLIVTNIIAIYNFKTKEINYEYELTNIETNYIEEVLKPNFR